MVTSDEDAGISIRSMSRPGLLRLGRGEKLAPKSRLRLWLRNALDASSAEELGRVEPEIFPVFERLYGVKSRRESIWRERSSSSDLCC